MHYLHEQQAQLSQRDHVTAVWVSFGQNMTALTFVGLFSTTVT